MYYIISSKRWKRVLATRSFDEAFEFLIKNKDAKIRTMDYKINPKIIDRRIFISDMYEASKKEPEDKIKVYKLTERMVRNRGNKFFFLNQLGLKEGYLKYKSLTQKLI